MNRSWLFDEPRQPGSRSPAERWHGRLGTLAAVLAATLFLSSLVGAQPIYRYQDAEGVWHFTDEPPADIRADQVPGIQTHIRPRGVSEAPQEATIDLATRLRDHFEPFTPIAEATLAAVTVRNYGGGEASGFFCSDDGHILTSARITVPPSLDYGSPEAHSARRFKELDTKQEALNDSRAALRRMEDDLEGYERVIERATNAAAKAWAEQSHQELKTRYEEERGRVEQMAQEVDALRDELGPTRPESTTLGRDSSNDGRFEIAVKGGMPMLATLVGLGSRDDVAILKVDGYRTPFLQMSGRDGLHQGMRVYAIGSEDRVTSGILTQVTPDQILTDAQIMPGDGGGPLVDENGRAIGVFMAETDPSAAGGFARAIPIDRVAVEFSGMCGGQPAVPDITSDPFQ